MFYGSFYSHLLLACYLPVPKQTFLGILSLFCSALLSYLQKLGAAYATLHGCLFVSNRRFSPSCPYREDVALSHSGNHSTGGWLGLCLVSSPGVCVLIADRRSCVQQLTFCYCSSWSLCQNPQSSMYGACLQGQEVAKPQRTPIPPLSERTAPSIPLRLPGGRNVPGTFVLLLCAGGRAWFSCVLIGRRLGGDGCYWLSGLLSFDFRCPPVRRFRSVPAVPAASLRCSGTGSLCANASGRVRRDLGGSAYAAREGRR